MPTPSEIRLAQALAGEFDNQPQASEQPVWFVHLKIWHRPLPNLIHNHLALFAEQAPVIKLHQPYRQRVFTLQSSSNSGQQLKVQYFAFKNPQSFKGAGANPSLFNRFTVDDLEPLPGCCLTVTETNGTFSAQPEPEDCCYFQYEGKKRQVILGFEVNDHQFKSYDRGVDPETGKLLWGALMGAYEFEKRHSFAQDLPL